MGYKAGMVCVWGQYLGQRRQGPELGIHWLLNFNHQTWVSQLQNADLADFSSTVWITTLKETLGGGIPVHTTCPILGCPVGSKTTQ